MLCPVKAVMNRPVCTGLCIAQEDSAYDSTPSPVKRNVMPVKKTKKSDVNKVLQAFPAHSIRSLQLGPIPITSKAALGDACHCRVTTSSQDCLTEFTSAKG